MKKILLLSFVLLFSFGASAQLSAKKKTSAAELIVKEININTISHKLTDNASFYVRVKYVTSTDTNRLRKLEGDIVTELSTETNNNYTFYPRDAYPNNDEALFGDTNAYIIDILIDNVNKQITANIYRNGRNESKDVKSTTKFSYDKKFDKDFTNDAINVNLYCRGEFAVKKRTKEHYTEAKNDALNSLFGDDTSSLKTFIKNFKIPNKSYKYSYTTKNSNFFVIYIEKSEVKKQLEGNITKINKKGMQKLMQINAANKYYIPYKKVFGKLNDIEQKKLSLKSYTLPKRVTDKNSFSDYIAKSFANYFIDNYQDSTTFDKNIYINDLKILTETDTITDKYLNEESFTDLGFIINNDDDAQFSITGTCELKNGELSFECKLLDKQKNILININKKFKDNDIIIKINANKIELSNLLYKTRIKLTDEKSWSEVMQKITLINQKADSLPTNDSLKDVISELKIDFDSILSSTLDSAMLTDTNKTLDDYSKICAYKFTSKIFQNIKDKKQFSGKLFIDSLRPTQNVKYHISKNPIQNSYFQNLGFKIVTKINDADFIITGEWTYSKDDTANFTEKLNDTNQYELLSYTFSVKYNTPDNEYNYIVSKNDKANFIPFNFQNSFGFEIGSKYGYNDELLRTDTISKSFEIAQVEVSNSEFVKFLNDTCKHNLQNAKKYILINSPYISVDSTVENIDKSQYDTLSYSLRHSYTQKIKNNDTTYYRVKEYSYRYTDNNDELPVVYVSYYGAKAYCDWKSDSSYTYRLPTEAEFEYVFSKIDEDVDINDKDEIINHAQFIGNSNDKLHKIKDELNDKFIEPISGNVKYKIYNILGNAWEITQTEYKTNQNYIIIKGGAFDSDYDQIHTYSNSKIKKDDQKYNVGFRLVREKK